MNLIIDLILQNELACHLHCFHLKSLLMQHASDTSFRYLYWEGKNYIRLIGDILHFLFLCVFYSLSFSSVPLLFHCCPNIPHTLSQQKLKESSSCGRQVLYFKRFTKCECRPFDQTGFKKYCYWHCRFSYCWSGSALKLTEITNNL